VSEKAVDGYIRVLTFLYGVALNVSSVIHRRLYDVSISVWAPPNGDDQLYTVGIGSDVKLNDQAIESTH